MARNLNIDYNRVITTSIMHTIENGRRFKSFGSTLSLRSPQRREIIREINPVVADEQKRLSHVRDGNGNPVAKVTLQYRPQRPALGLSSSRRTKADLISNAQTEGTVLTEDVIYDQHNEYAEKFTQAQLMKLEPAAETYLNSVNKGLQISNKDKALWQGLAEVGERIIERIETGIFVPLNTYATSNLIASIGTNLVDNSTAAALPVIVLFDADGRVKKDLLVYLSNIMRSHALSYKPIIVGGTLMANWVQAMGWTSVQDLGYDGEKMMQNMPFEFYFDSDIDASYGWGRILIQDAGAAAMEFVAEHGEVIQADKVSDTTFTRASMSLLGFDTQQTTIDFDLRIIESDANAYPEVYVAPSLRAGMFTRPAGAIKTYGGFENVTGIWGARLVEYEADI